MLRTSICTDLGAIPAKAWDSLVGHDQPFLEHGFLRLLETSHSVGPESGWRPGHILVHEEDELIAAMPCYVKDNSRGEFIFDWGWAESSMAAGIPYYPKLLVGLPFTPATGERILVHPGRVKAEVLPALIAGLEILQQQVGAHSIHLLFCEKEEAKLMATHGFVQRTTHQFHWFNQGYEDFDDFLGRLRSRARKQIRKERRRVAELDLVIRRRLGHEIAPATWRRFDLLYRQTYARKWGSPYLSPAFFHGLSEAFGHRVLLVTAEQDGDLVAASLSFYKGSKLFGRYWGAQSQYDCLHFELCYYQLIEHAIIGKLSCIEAGAQGDHKVKRGFIPCPIYSSHRLSHPGLHAAVRDFVVKEATQTTRLIKLISEHLPYRKDQIQDR